MSLKRKHRLGGLHLLVLSCVIAAGGCAFLLDTDELKDGAGVSAGGTGASAGSAGAAGSAGSAGAAGSGGIGGAGGDAGQAGSAGSGGEPPRTCQVEDPFGCMEQPNDDPCTKDWCDNGTCRRIDHVGAGLVAQTDTTEFLDNQEEIGPLSLTVDADGNFYLGFWHVDPDGKSDVEIRKHVDNPNTSPTLTTLKGLFSEFKFVHSSPALAVDGSKLLVAVAASKQAESGMFKIELKLSDLTQAAGGAPALLDLDNYAGYPAGVAVPRIGLNGGKRLVIWPFDGGIRMREWSTIGTADKYDLGTSVATNLVALPGMTSQPFGAVVEATVSGSEKLMVWTEPQDLLGTEFDGTPGARLGLSASAIEPKAITEAVSSMVSWAYKDSAGKAALKLGFAACLGSSCVAQTFAEPGIVATEGMRPSVSVRKEFDSANLRRVALLYAIHSRESATEALGGLVMNLFQLDLDDKSKEVPFEELAYNPPVALVEAVDGAVPADPLKSPYKHTAIAVHPDGHMMIAWVYQPDGEPASLRFRRYEMKSCP